MTSGALCSDHINYLILRYLQEAGHEDAATAFYRDWHRLPEYRDPENYPFAPVVRRGELVHVIQDGLHHDELVARVKKNERRFRFTSADPRDGGAAVLENGTGNGGSRPTSSSAKRKGRPPVMRAPDEFPTPAPKRQRRSEGSEGVHLNGDAMEVDAGSASADAEGEDDGEAVSPTVASEIEVLEVPERYDSMDVAVQTDVKTGPKTSTMSWKVERPGARIHHSMWNPGPSHEDARTLLAVGESLCRFYQVPDSAEDARQILSVEDISIPPNSWITASAWHPKGHTAVCAVDSVRELHDGRRVSDHKLLGYSREHGTLPEYLYPPLLEPAGVVLALRYSSDGAYLLVARTNLKRGLVLVYNTSTDAESVEPIAWRIFRDPVLDVAWLYGHTFVICGENGSLNSCCVEEPNTPLPKNGFTPQTIPLHGLTELPVRLMELDRKWDKLCYDERTGACALVSTADRRLCIGTHPKHNAGYSIFFDAYTNLSAQLTAFAFQPALFQTEHDTVSTLVTTYEDGACAIYQYSKNETLSLPGIEPIRLCSFHLSEGPALALAWSPDGRYLAIGGPELVEIWDAENLVQRQGNEHAPLEVNCLPDQPLKTWRLADSGARNGEHEEDPSLCEPSLSWSADGERLAFAIDNQISVISFRPPLARKAIAPPVENGVGGSVNGHASSP
ncbi:hypothetical protein LTR37_016557 [Vermiconidia calcicola]|uniref:Uncharacterized protein n=1 Tax=Vermiconidia calcicola TaxID=1690605 RepID=A0ACC3MQ85_9PEZI|nr:hypothetical protein LTR37_016557 [Vermiconidia calcicola]